MKKKLKKIFSGLLITVMLCTSVNFSAIASNQVYVQGNSKSLVLENGQWCYKEGGNKATDAFIKIGEKHYYFGEDGFLVKPDREGNTDAGFELMEINGELHFVDFTGNIWTTHGWLLTKDGRFPEDKNSYWFYRTADGDIISGNENGPRIKTVNSKKYAFDEKGHMMQNHIVQTDEGTFYALNNYNGELAHDRWLYIDGEWHYFDENGIMLNSSGNSPYNEIEEIQLQYNGKLELNTGDMIEIPISFTVASDSNAERQEFKENNIAIEDDSEEAAIPSTPDSVLPASPSNAIQIMSNRNKNFTVEDGNYYSGKKASDVMKKAYNFGCQVEPIEIEEGKNSRNGLTFDDNNASISYTSTVPCKVSIYFEMDDKESNHIEVTFVAKEDVSEKDTKDRLNQIIGEQPKTVVDGLKALNKQNLIQVLQENEKDIVNKIAEIEQNYAMEYNIGLKNEMTSNLFSEFDSGKIKTVGATMNAESGSDVVFHMDKSSEEIDSSSINKARKIPIDLTLLVNGSAVSELEIPIVITMPIPESMESNSVEVYHYHEGQQSKMQTKVDSANKTITFTTDKFSTFLFAGNLKTSGGSSGSSGGGGGSSSGGRSVVKTDSLEVSGTWTQDEFGWKFSRLDGKTTESQWLMNGGNWFKFDDKGYMLTGWFTDTDGKKYYLNPISDGTRGAMKTGWQLIDGIWYYFNSISDGTKGVLLINTVTPDGYTVNADGQWFK